LVSLVALITLGALDPRIPLVTLGPGNALRSLITDWTRRAL
jgi:hypothetical protein